ncbi:hypothetical protein SAMN06265367_10417 [Algoriphagus winogradskyi]|uniref:Uncharacterized protein n=1 Tax=Algoriphagus winogradskyi TaxID=237017 RepID=A0ABY1P3D3_9BACT|nr:hypothetical protein SAMN06265367_10417 [Algoriphagus winogradskyi]
MYQLNKKVPNFFGTLSGMDGLSRLFSGGLEPATFPMNRDKHSNQMNSQ